MRIWLATLVSTLLALAAFGVTAQTTARAGADADSSYAHADWLVSADWLKRHVDDPAIRVIAVTPAAEFTQAHIPGAARIGWRALDVTRTSPASIAQWRRAVEHKLTQLGIRRRDTIVIYDGGTLFAARLWWVLDYLGQPDKRILNGGLAAWLAADGTIEHGQSHVRPAPLPYHGNPRATALATLDEVRARLGDPRVVLIDARTAAEYSRGHIPGAVNVDYPRNAVSSSPHFWKPAAALRHLYAGIGAAPDKMIIPYCSTGVRSAVTYFTLRLIGYPDVQLYTGSWAEWRQHPELPQVAGEHP